MARLIRHEAQMPHIIKKAEMEREVIAICMCGLSQSSPFCDGSHKKAKDEEAQKLYHYDKAGNRVELKGF